MSPTDDFLYDHARQLFATAQINWPTAHVNAMIVSELYVPALSDVNVADVLSGAIIVRDLVCTGMAAPKGVCSCQIPQMNSLLSAYIATAVILYIKGSDDAHSPLVYYSSTGPGFPFALQGFDYSVGFDQLNGGFFQV